MSRGDLKFKFKKAEPFEGKPAYDALLDGKRICSVFKKESGSWAVVRDARFHTGFNTRSDAAASEVSSHA